MIAVRFGEADIAPAEGGGYTLASCEPYWIVLAVFAETPGFLFEWTGSGWSDLLSDSVLFDRTGAEEAVQILGEFPGRTARSVNFADYLRFDRMMAGDPRHHPAKLQHAGSEAALQEIYRAVFGHSPEERS